MAKFHRKGTLLINSSGRPAWGSSYTVRVYHPGTYVSGNFTSQTTINHETRVSGITTGNKVIFGTDATTFRTVQSSTTTSITLDSAVTALDATRIIDLGSDTGTTTPSYNGSPASIYSDSELTSSVSSVTVASNGEYEYWTTSPSVWEVVRTSTGTLTEIIDEVPFNLSISLSGTSTVYNGIQELQLEGMTVTYIAPGKLNISGGITGPTGATGATGATYFSGLTDVSGTWASGLSIRYDSTLGKFTPINLDNIYQPSGVGGATNFSGLTDVNGTWTSGQIARFDGTNWTPYTPVNILNDPLPTATLEWALRGPQIYLSGAYQEAVMALSGSLGYEWTSLGIPTISGAGA